MDSQNMIFDLDQSNEQKIKTEYDRLILDNQNGYSLVSIKLKNFITFSHMLADDKGEDLIQVAYNRLCTCLSDDEYIVRIHSYYFNLLIKCEANLDDLHRRAHEFHFAVKNFFEENYGRPLYLEMGYCPLNHPDVDFYTARYYAEISRMASEYTFPETNYDMYYISYQDQKEDFLKLENLVPEALANGDFKLYLQPKVNLATGQVDSAEALVRWIDPKRGMIPLTSFLPNIEENGFIREMDLYLFDKACSYMERWLKEYGRKFSISFNLSKAYFNGTFFMDEFTSAFKKYNISPDSVRIELLESIVLNDIEHLLPLVTNIYEFGFSCALDDFGSGFSSFDILTSVKLSELKIDRSLFKDITNDKERSLICHIVDIAHDMDMEVVAEGIETEDYANYLKEIGCDFIQGFYYYKPMPVDEFEKLFITNTQQGR
ncbi:EAL domain-containing protein [Anaerorhabdus sp.]|uniref:EAL domain-containing protein n=1 Tax=Anaerorhabdus sp. TaxID=1872524 RepID=UPI002FC907F9